MTAESQALGLDIGGSGVKAAVVDLERGELVSERVRPAYDEANIRVFDDVTVLERFEDSGRVDAAPG